MAASSLVTRLLAELDKAHRLLLQQAGNAGPAAQQGLESVLVAARAATVGVSPLQLAARPAEGEWSMAEVIEHMVEHDRHYVELARDGIDHYVEHGLEHALQLWSLRAGAGNQPEDGAGSGRASATLK